MTYEELQVENGNFTRIINPLIDELLKVPFKGCELSVAFYIIRKTYGYNKTQDSISLSQFQKDLNRSRQTIVTALHNLRLVNIARLVKKGNMKGACNIWAINKYTDQWKLVNTARLVQRKHGKRPNLVYTARHTKDINTQKTYSKATASPKKTFNPLGSELIKSFEVINPACKRYYGNTTQREACDNLIKEYSLERVKLVIEKTLPKTNLIEFFPHIFTPLQLWEKWTTLESKVKEHQLKQQVKSKVIFSS